MQPGPEADASVLRAAASTARELTGEALAYRDAIEQARTRLTEVWTGSLRHEPATATAYAAEAARKVSEGLGRLHRAVTCLDEAAAGLTSS